MDWRLYNIAGQFVLECICDARTRFSHMSFGNAISASFASMLPLDELRKIIDLVRNGANPR